MGNPKLPPEALEFFKQQGAKGGKLGGAKAWERLTPEERSARAKNAVAAREAKRAREKAAPVSDVEIRKPTSTKRVPKSAAAKKARGNKS